MSSVSSGISFEPSRLSREEGRTSAYSELTSDEFMQIMLTELSNQDPLDPNDSQAMLEQISTIRSIESDIQIGDRLESVVRESSFASATTLIGTLISGLDENGRRVSDVVLSVSRTEEGPVLNLFDGSRVPFDGVDEVVTPGALDDLFDEGDGSSEGEGDADGGDDGELVDEGGDGNEADGGDGGADGEPQSAMMDDAMDREGVVA